MAYRTNISFNSNPFFDENPFLNPDMKGILGEEDYSEPAFDMPASPFNTQQDQIAAAVNETLGIPQGQQIEPFSQQQAVDAVMNPPQNQLPPMPPPVAQKPQGILGKIAAFGQSPGWAQARQGIQNRANAMRNQPVTRSATQAYQETVQRNALLRQQERMAKLREAQEARLTGAEGRAQEAHDANMDPAWEYNALMEAGLLPEDMDFTAYQTKFGKTAASDPSAVREWRYYNSLNENEKAEYLQMKRAAQLVPFGGGTQGVVGPGNVTTPLPGGPSAEGFAEREGIVAEGLSLIHI